MQKLIHTPEGELIADDPFQVPGTELMHTTGPARITEASIQRQNDNLKREPAFQGQWADFYGAAIGISWALKSQLTIVKRGDE